MSASAVAQQPNLGHDAIPLISPFCRSPAPLDHHLAYDQEAPRLLFPTSLELRLEALTKARNEAGCSSPKHRLGRNFFWEIWVVGWGR
jgi:hypothetical protein